MGRKCRQNVPLGRVRLLLGHDEIDTARAVGDQLANALDRLVGLARTGASENKTDHGASSFNFKLRNMTARPRHAKARDAKSVSLIAATDSAVTVLTRPSRK